MGSSQRARACESGIEDSYLSSLQSEIDDLERVLCRRCRTKAVDVSVDMNDAELDDLAERIAIDACMADSPDASFDYKGDWLVKRGERSKDQKLQKSCTNPLTSFPM